VTAPPILILLADLPNTMQEALEHLIADLLLLDGRQP
jgi:hypothetical protein